jgi:hypothetical protein
MSVHYDRLLGILRCLVDGGLAFLEPVDRTKEAVQYMLRETLEDMLHETVDDILLDTVESTQLAI